MLVPLPRLTSSFRGPYDVDQAYLCRKRILRNLNSRRANDEPELARKLIPHWDKASAELHQAYRQFVGSVVEMVNGEVSSEEFREVAKTAYDLFGHFHMDNDMDNDLTKSITQKKIELQRLIGYNIEDAIVQKMASLAQRLYALQHTPNNALVAQEIGADGCGDSTIEFGSDLSFQVPSRFVLDVPSENVTPLSSDFLPTSTFDDNHYSHTHFANHDSTTDQRTGSLKWLKDACDMIVQHDGASQISGDELAMALCRVLLSNKAGDEIAGDLLDLVGDGSFETVQDLLLHRKELVNAIQHGLFILKSEKISSNNQPKMPSYGTQVTVQTESERQMDKFRRKEEKRNKRLGEYGNTLDFPVESFYSLLLASQKKQPLDDLIGIGHGLNSVLISALPEGTIRLHNSGYEEVRIPPQRRKIPAFHAVS